MQHANRTLYLERIMMSVQLVQVMSINVIL